MTASDDSELRSHSLSLTLSLTLSLSLSLSPSLPPSFPPFKLLLLFPPSVCLFRLSVPLVQVFTERGFVTRVLMASFDLSKLKQLDKQLTKVLSDMQVGRAERGWLPQLFKLSLTCPLKLNLSSSNRSCSGRCASSGSELTANSTRQTGCR